jgi:hypothetical protein
MQQQGYAITPEGVRRIQETVGAYFRSKKQGQDGWYEYRNVRKDKKNVSGGGAVLVIGKTTGAWAKGSVESIAVYAGDPLADTGTTYSAMNLFADIQEDKWVACISGFLVSAEC